MHHSSVTIIKNDHTGREVWRYEGTVLERGDNHIVLEAYFDRNEVDMSFVTLRRGDRFVETFYDNRWYCVFEVHAANDDRLQGWYCNMGRPAEISEDTVVQDDLALDLWVAPDGTPQMLDRAEFDNLPISDEERQRVLNAAVALQQHAVMGRPPFEQRD